MKKIKATYVSIASILALCAMSSFALASTATTNVLPAAPSICMPDVQGCNGMQLLNWSSQNTISKYYKQVTPLVKRDTVTNRLGNVVPYYGFSTTPAQFAFGNFVPQETNWQYLQSLVYFGGSQSGGQVIIPAPGWIHAAHQNGVKIYGTIFFSPSVFGGDKEIKAIEDMVTPGQLQNQIAKQLASIAQTYGFDGWMINQETESFSAKQLSGMKSFIHQLHLDDPSLTVTWYDDATNSLSHYSDLLSNLLIDNTNNTELYSPVFVNYGWSQQQQYAQQAALDKYPVKDIHYGVDVPNLPPYNWSAAKSTFTQVYPSPATSYGSITEWNFMTFITHTANGSVGTSDLNTLNSNERNFWTNGNRPGTDGASQYVASFTPITQLPFYTHFNTGEGSDYFIDGKAQQVGKWNDIGQQDILPTWQFMSTDSNTSDKVHVGYDYSQAYSGGSSLQVTASDMLSKEVITVPLYRTNASLTAKDVVQFISKSSQPNLDASVCVATDDGKLSCFSSTGSSNNQWVKKSSSLSAFAGSTVKQIYLKLQAIKPIKNVEFNLGGLYLGASSTGVHAVNLQPSTTPNCKPGVDCVSWQSVKSAVNYLVFNDASQFVGATHQTIISVANDNNPQSNYSVEALGANGSVIE